MPLHAHKAKERDSAAPMLPVETGTMLAFSTLDEEGTKTVAQTSDKPGEPDSEFIQTTPHIILQLQVKSFAALFP